MKYYKIHVYRLYIIITLTTTFNRNNRKESLTTFQNARQSNGISVRDSLLKCLYEIFARIHSSHSWLYLIELETSNAAGTRNAQLLRRYLSIVGPLYGANFRAHAWHMSSNTWLASQVRILNRSWQIQFNQIFFLNISMLLIFLITRIK